MPISHAQLLEMQARLGRNKAQVSKSVDACDDEGELHRAVVEKCRELGWLVFHGSMAHATHRTKGEPDLIIVTHGGVLFVELKTKTGKLSHDQAGVLVWLDMLGHKLHVIRSMSEFQDLIRTQRSRKTPEASESSLPPG